MENLYDYNTNGSNTEIKNFAELVKEIYRISL